MEQFISNISNSTHYIIFILHKYQQKMENRPPLILSPDSLLQSSPKYKFWNTSLAGPQRSPKNMSLVTASKEATENKTQPQEQPPNEENLQVVKSDSEEEVNKSESEEEQSELNSHEAKIQQMQEEMQRLQAQIEQGRALNQNLLKELNKTTNQLRVSESLNAELNQECDKLYTNVKLSHEKQSQVQNQKMNLLIQLSALNQQKQLAVNKSQIYEEQVEYLNKKIQSLHEQISFEKQMGADLSKEILILKEQLNKMMTMMQGYSQLQEEVARSYQINQQIQKRVIYLEEELKHTRMHVEQSEKNEQLYIEEQGKLFLRIQQLENQNKILIQKLNYAESEIRYKNEEFLAIQGQQSECEPRYVKILQQYEKRNSDLVFQVMALNERNRKLLDQRDFYMIRVQNSSNIRNERLPYDQFVSILKATDHQVQTLKRQLSLKQDQIQQLKSQHMNQQINMSQKIRELTNIIEIREREQQSQKQIINNEILIYKKQCEHMMRKNQQLKNQTVKLKLEVMNKDRIIIQFVEKQKYGGEGNRFRVQSRQDSLTKSIR